MLSKLVKALLLILLFTIPFQTRFVYAPAYLGGAFWEYGSLSIYATELLAGLVVFLFLTELCCRSNFLKIFGRQYFLAHGGRLVGVFLILFGLGFLVYHSVDYQVSYQYVTRVLLALAIGVVVASFTKFPKFRYQLCWAFWLGGVGQGVFAIYQFFIQSVPHWHGWGLAPHFGQLGDAVIETLDGRWLRAYGSFGSPNSLGIYLAIILVIGLIIYLQSNQRNKIFITVGQLVIVAGLIFTFSRGAWLGAIVGIIFLSFIVYRFSSKLSKQLFLPLIYYLLLTITIISICPSLFFTRFNLANRLEMRSISERVDQLMISRQLLAGNYLFGVGPGAFSSAWSRLEPAHAAWYYQPVHNVLMLILVEWGVATFVLFGVFLGWLIKNVKRQSFIWPILATMFVGGLFDHWLVSMWSGLVVLAVAPILVSTLSMDKEGNLC